MPHETAFDGYLISDDPTRIDVAVVHAFLSRSYWAAGVPRDVVERSLANSLCLGFYAPDGKQVGLIRVITDRATFAYLCDVFVLEGHRGRGLAKAGLACLLRHPDLQGLRRMQLITQDAHSLYAQFGFTTIAEPQRHMERRNPNAYRR